jgi:hypothetical protein
MRSRRRPQLSGAQAGHVLDEAAEAQGPISQTGTSSAASCTGRDTRCAQA